MSVSVDRRDGVADRRWSASSGRRAVSPEVRSEALVHALEHHRMAGPASPTEVVAAARSFEEYLSGSSAEPAVRVVDL